MAPPLDVIGSWVVGTVAAGGSGKYLYDLVVARYKGRKEGAEGTAILVNSASAYARQLQEDATAARREAREAREEFHAYRREQQARFREHADWDAQVWRKLRDLGEVIPEPPPLYA